MPKGGNQRPFIVDTKQRSCEDCKIPRKNGTRYCSEHLCRVKDDCYNKPCWRRKSREATTCDLHTDPPPSPPPAECAANRCQIISIKGFLYCRLHACTVRSCSENAIPAQGKNFCDDHKCSVPECQILRKQYLETGKDRLLLADYCETHECLTKDCQKPNEPSKKHCSEHCCMNPDCPDVRQTFFDEALILCRTHHDEQVRTEGRIEGAKETAARLQAEREKDEDIRKVREYEKDSERVRNENKPSVDEQHQQYRPEREPEHARFRAEGEHTYPLRPYSISNANSYNSPVPERPYVDRNNTASHGNSGTRTGGSNGPQPPYHSEPSRRNDRIRDEYSERGARRETRSQYSPPGGRMGGEYDRLHVPDEAYITDPNRSSSEYDPADLQPRRWDGHTGQHRGTSATVRSGSRDRYDGTGQRDFYYGGESINEDFRNSTGRQEYDAHDLEAEDRERNRERGGERRGGGGGDRRH